MKKIILMLILTTIPILAGMGAMQGPTSPEKIPVPAKLYQATFVDQMGVVTECTEISIEGAIYLEGKRGEGNYTIAFDNIEQVAFRVSAERLIGMVKLHAGPTTDLVLDKKQKAYGRTRHGTFQIKLIDLKTMTIEAPPR